MSSLSSGSSVAKASHFGIPKRCWCGASAVAKLWRSEGNPYRRYYRCSFAASAKLVDDNHVFKWVDDAFVNEIEALSDRIARLENGVKTMSSYMEDQERFAREKVENEVIEEVEELVGDTKWRIQVISIGVVLVCVISLGVMKWVG